MTIGSTQDFATFLKTGYWDWVGTGWRAFTTTDVTFNVDGLTAERQTVALNALSAWDSAISINFRQVHSGGMIIFDDPAGQANTTYTLSGHNIIQDFVNIGDDFNGGSETGYTIETFIHEIGHAIGLGHAGYYNASAVESQKAYENDSTAVTLMSYFHNDATFYTAPKTADALAGNQLYTGIGVADMMITNIKTSPSLQNYIHVALSVTNAGGGSAPASNALIFIDGNYSGDRAIPALAAGQTYTDVFDWNFGIASGTHTFTSSADGFGTVFEGNESNNGSAGSTSRAVWHGTISNGFDSAYYLHTYADVAASGADPLAHYNNYGWHEGRNPNAFFDTNFYLSHYGDVAAAGVNPLSHYVNYGWHEGRDSVADLDTSVYLATYADVAAANVDPMTHFNNAGINEGRFIVHV